MNRLYQPTFWVKFYLSGPIEVAKQVLREECMKEGLCVTIEPTTFIYTGGEELGYVVGLLNYSRFPSTPDQIEAKAKTLMAALLAGTFQHSALMKPPTVTEWITRRTA